MAGQLLGKLTSPQLVENRKTLFLLVFLALSAVVISIFQAWTFVQGLLENERIVEESTFNRLTNLRQQAALQLSNNALTLQFISQSPVLISFASSSEADQRMLRELFASVLVARPEFFQLRLLDLTGHEKLRVDKVNGTLVFYDVEQLQDKSDRYYFKKSVRLERGEFYVSRLDLNVEKGVIQTPWQPTLRLATPVVDARGSKLGVVVINVDAKKIIQLYESKQTKGTYSALIDGRGYWLSGKESNRLWGAMFMRSPDVPEDYPEIWASMTHAQKDQYSYNVNNENWFIQTTRVGNLFADELQPKNKDDVIWHALVVAKETPPFTSTLGTIPVFVIIAVLCVFSYVWVKSVNRGFETRKELIKSEKLASLGSLVAGVSHELGTPLGSALTMASTIEEKSHDLMQTMALGQLKKSEILNFVRDTEEASDIMQNALHRAAELIGHFKQVAVDQSAQICRKFDLDEYLVELSATFKHLFKHNQIQFELNLNSSAKVNSYPGSLSQVVINLVNNALVHGFKDNDTGKIEISTHNLSDEFVAIDVKDTGRGIPQEIINRVFEPFFTTRLGSGGSGLGLHISRTIVMDILEGSIEVFSSTRDHYTQFRIVIPRHIKKITHSLAREDKNYV